MNSDIKLRRDPFAFSLRGILVASSHAMVPAVADNGINKSWHARLRQLPGPDQRGEQPQSTRQFEALLARYFAHGCCASNY